MQDAGCRTQEEFLPVVCNWHPASGHGAPARAAPGSYSRWRSTAPMTGMRSVVSRNGTWMLPLICPFCLG